MQVTGRESLWVTFHKSLVNGIFLQLNWIGHSNWNNLCLLQWYLAWRNNKLYNVCRLSTRLETLVGRCLLTCTCIPAFRTRQKLTEYGWNTIINFVICQRLGKIICSGSRAYFGRLFAWIQWTCFSIVYNLMVLLNITYNLILHYELHNIHRHALEP